MRIFAVFLLAWILCAQVPSRVQPGYDSIQASRLRAQLTFLASDALEGRRSLDRGSEVAIQWIASQFAGLGLKPAAGDSSLQPVPLIEYTADRTATSLIVRQGEKVQTYLAPDATSTFPHETSVSGAVVFAGYGITAPELNYDDYKALDARGKIVLIFNHEPQENNPDSVFNGIGNSRYANLNPKIRNAQQHGAIAVLTMADPSHPPAAPQGGRGTPANPRPRIPSEALAEGGAGIPVFAISPQLADRLFAGSGKVRKDVHAAIDDGLKPAPFEIANTKIDLRTVLTERRRATTYNVAGLLEGSDPALRSETIVFSGHFDHEGIGPAGIYRGADDNGSGTVGVVELARAFALNPAKPKRSLLFIVFAAEERGLLGSHYYAAQPLRPLATTRAHLNFDMIGRNEAPTNPNIPQPNISADTTNELGLIGTHYSPDYREVVERHNKTVGLKLTYKWDRDAAQSILFRSDQYPLLLRNIPAVWWFTGFHPDYHQVTDTVEKINFEKMTRILKLAYLSGWEFADAQNPPGFLPRAMSRN